MRQLDTVALALRYPTTDSAAVLEAELDRLPEGRVRKELGRFVSAVSRLSLGAWEELHTRTLDLSPLFVPYVGHVAWGENYRRGAFMAELKAAQDDAGVDRHGELPDHLDPVLRMVPHVELIPDLEEVLERSVAQMRKDLAKAERDNPYRHVLAAASAAIAEREKANA